MLKVWKWRYTDEFGKRRTTRWHMSEDDASKYKDAEKVPGTEESRTPAPSTSAFLGSLKSLRPDE
jgi:hypothetical protein